MSDIILDPRIYENVKIKLGDKVLADFSFNPSDSNIVQRYDEFIEGLNDLEKRIVEYEKAKEKKSDFDKDKVKLYELENEIRKKVDILLNADASKNIFGVMGALTPLPSGDYYFTFIIEQIGNKVNNATGQRVKKMEMKIKKHTQKYHG